MNNVKLAAVIDDSVQRQQIPAREATEEFLFRIHRSQPILNALVTVTERRAREDAERVDRARAAGERLPLDGMPIVIKDNIDLAGYLTSNGSLQFENDIAVQDAEVASRLRLAGAVILGKAHLHELAFGVTSDSAYGVCQNPWDRQRIPGGSSSGSGVAVAADLCVGALGTDTGGSIRIPSAVNGIVGLRPTHGAVSMRGALPLAQSFDTIGPMARSVIDVARMFTAITGYDPQDPWSQRPAQMDGLGDDLRTVKGLKIGVAREYFFEDIDPEIGTILDAALGQLSNLGVLIEEVAVTGAREVSESYAAIVSAEAFVNYSTIGTRSLRESTLARLEMGKRISGSDIIRSRNAMVKWRRLVEQVFIDGVDLILTPALKTKPPLVLDIDELSAIDVMTRTTRPWSLAQLPSITIPCGSSSEGLPVGLQLTALPWHEPVLFRVGAAYQAVTSWHLRRPPLKFLETDSKASRQQ